MNPINNAFESASKVIFGQEIVLPDEYEEFLCERIKKVKTIKSVFGKEVHYNPISFFEEIPKDRIVGRYEVEEVSKLNIRVDNEDSLERIMKKISKIALYQVDMWEGNNQNIIKSSVIDHCVNVYYVGDCAFGKNCAYCTLAVETDSVFGSFRASYSKFCIRCENSVNLTACFEMDSCTNCANSMFCHNCENLDNCMFCFNTKSKRYAIGNVEIGREKYMEIRERILAEIVRKLTKDKKLDIDIYKLGERRG